VGEGAATADTDAAEAEAAVAEVAVAEAMRRTAVCTINGLQPTPHLVLTKTYPLDCCYPPSPGATRWAMRA
jgi:hypothetical protein